MNDKRRGLVLISQELDIYPVFHAHSHQWFVNASAIRSLLCLFKLYNMTIITKTSQTGSRTDMRRHYTAPLS